MERKSIYYEGYSLSPLDVFEWIKNGAFEYIKAQNELGGVDSIGKVIKNRKRRFE